MYVNKFTLPRRFLLRLYDLVPPLRVLKKTSLPFKIRKLRGRIAAKREQLAASQAASGRDPLFTHVEVETINRCNGECGFCPVNRHIDPRKATRMKEELFRRILEQLRELDFAGSFYLFSNNEPLLDTRICDFAALARERLPRASIRFYTNGILLTQELYRRLIPNIDVFTINNYCDDFRIHPHLREIYDASQADPATADKTYLVMRYRREIMTSRAGLSPNKQDLLSPTLPVGCLLPARQLIIRPDGRVSLCCNDAFGAVTLGDLNHEKIADVWYGATYARLRREILEARSGVDLCRNCDTIHF